MEKTVYLYAAQDGRDNDFNYILLSDLGLPANSLLRLRIVRQTRMRDVANTILRRLGNSNSIQKMVVLSHGNAGQVMIGETLTSSNLSDWGPLRAKFSGSNDGVIFHGCRIASAEFDRNPRRIHVLDGAACDLMGNSEDLHQEMSGTWVASRRISIGYGFLFALARTLHVTVTAPVDRQRTVLERRQGRPVDVTGFEGRYVRVFPDPEGRHEMLQGTSYNNIYHEFCE